MKEEMGIEGEVGADTVTREMKIVMIIKDMSMIWSTMAKRVMTRSNDDVNDNRNLLRAEEMTPSRAPNEP